MRRRRRSRSHGGISRNDRGEPAVLGYGDNLDFLSARSYYVPYSFAHQQSCDGRYMGDRPIFRVCLVLSDDAKFLHAAIGPPERYGVSKGDNISSGRGGSDLSGANAFGEVAHIPQRSRRNPSSLIYIVRRLGCRVGFFSLPQSAL